MSQDHEIEMQIAFAVFEQCARLETARLIFHGAVIRAVHEPPAHNCL